MCGYLFIVLLTLSGGGSRAQEDAPVAVSRKNYGDTVDVTSPEGSCRKQVCIFPNVTYLVTNRVCMNDTVIKNQCKEINISFQMAVACILSKKWKMASFVVCSYIVSMK